jgi:FkbM family methyltransferase
MLISFNDIVSKYGLPRGIVHIGAHLMEERSDYLSKGLNNTIWVEANPNIFRNINFVNNENSKERAFNFAISENGNQIVKLNVTNNGQSSSLLDLEKHKTHHPHIYVSETIDVESKRVDSLFAENDIDINEYNFVNLDIQGMELSALKSFGELLTKVDFIYTEVNTNFLYKDCCLIGEIDEYLSNYGFKRVETSMTQYEWGDALYVSERI